MERLELRERGKVLSSEGQLIGFLSPLKYLYWRCSTQISQEREKAIAEIVGDFGLRFENLGVLVIGSLSCGMSVSDSDIDLTIFAPPKDGEVYNSFTQELNNRLPGVEIDSQLDLITMRAIQETLDFLIDNPGISSSEINQSCGSAFVDLIDFFIMIKRGGLFFGNSLDWFMGRVGGARKVSPILDGYLVEVEQKMAAIALCEEWETEEKNSEVLESSIKFQSMSDWERWELRGAIAFFWKKLEERGMSWDDFDDFLYRKVFYYR